MIGYIGYQFDADYTMVAHIAYGGKRLSNLYTYFRLDEANIAYSIGRWRCETRYISVTDEPDYYNEFVENNKLRAKRSLKYYGVPKW